MTDPIARIHAVRAARAARGLIAICGSACATYAQLDYYNLRYRLRQRPDWGNLPQHLHAELVAARAKARAST